MIQCAFTSGCPCGQVIAPGCNANDGCDLCPTCIDQCLCETGDILFCQQECGAVLPPQGGCGAFNDCIDCRTCIGQESCWGTDANEALSLCEAFSCELGDCADCRTPSEACLCEGRSSSDCFEENFGITECRDYWGEGTWGACGCDFCGDLMLMCKEDEFATPTAVGCMNILECKQDSGCVGPGCLLEDVCPDMIDQTGGPGSTSHGLAEALEECLQRQGCPPVSNAPPIPPDTTCGAQSCYNLFLPAEGLTLNACCAAGFEGGETCGLDLGPIFADAYCEPRANPGFVSSECNPIDLDWPYYQTLNGCCRPDGICGYDDTVTGLGCAYPLVFDPAAEVFACDPTGF